MISYILNLPWTALGLCLALLSLPYKLRYEPTQHAILIHVKSFWWAFGYMRNARAVTVGHIILLSPRIEAGDIEHELIHVKQFDRLPLIFPILYSIELLRKGYRNNKYEEEAYRAAGNIYRG